MQQKCNSLLVINFSEELHNNIIAYTSTKDFKYNVTSANGSTCCSNTIA